MNRVLRNIRENKQLYQTALYLGLTGYGGLAVMEQIKQEYVVKKKIITERRFLHALSLSQILPGSNIINLVALFSYLKAGLIGAIIGTAVYILPTFVLTTLFAAVYFRYSSVSVFKTALMGLNILLVPLLLNALFSLAKSIYVQKQGVDMRSVALSGVVFVLYYFSGLNLLLTMFISGLTGVAAYTMTGYFKEKELDMQVVEGAFIRRKKAWLGLLFSIFFLYVALYILAPRLWILFSSFFRIGFLAFGGGVAAIPLIQAVFVNNLHLFTNTQFWDGIAISQVTPGPIFIASAFFGYKIAGILGSLIATIAMCIPSVIIIILASKIHDRIERSPFVKGMVRGFLAGFMGVLAALVVSQAHRALAGWGAAVAAVLAFIAIVKLPKGFAAAFLICLAYAFFFAV